MQRTQRIMVLAALPLAVACSGDTTRAETASQPQGTSAATTPQNATTAAAGAPANANAKPTTPAPGTSTTTGRSSGSTAGAAASQPSQSSGGQAPDTAPKTNPGGAGTVAVQAAPTAAAAAGSGGNKAAGAAGPANGPGTAGAPAPRDTQDTDASVGCDSDPIAPLRRHAPKDADLAKSFEQYLTKELGPVKCATEGTGQPRALMQTILVPAGATYDGKGETLTPDDAMKCDKSDDQQGESQHPLFVLAPGAKLKNVTFKFPGCDGVHMMGDNELDNVTWQDAGEDAASVRSYFPGGSIVIKNSEGNKASDKMFQFNAPCDVRIENFKGSEMGKLVRQNGGEDFPLHIDLNNVEISGVVSAVVQTDSPQCTVRYHGLTYKFAGSGDKADRVFKGVSAQNVMEY